MKSASGLVEYAKAQLGRPYWYGTYGNLASGKLWSVKSTQYKKYYTEARKQTAIKRGDYGKKVHDCSGLIKGYLMSNGPDMAPTYKSIYDLSANGFKDRAVEKGAIGSIPEIPGLAVWRNNHIGIYIGNGEVIEAKGFDYGVVKSKLAGSTFTMWLKLPFIEYSSAPAPTPAPAPVSDVWDGFINTKYDPLNIRRTSDPASQVVGIVPKGSTQKFKGEPVTNMARLADGRGWCSMRYIKRV